MSDRDVFGRMTRDEDWMANQYGMDRNSTGQLVPRREPKSVLEFSWLLVVDSDVIFP